jgi:tetratricopeptide (TPR) repeat protein
MISMRCFLISSLLLVAFARDAVADRKISDAAKAELERGEERFRQKDYAGAIAAFDAGYALDPQPIFLYDKAQAQRLAGDCATAIDTYKQFLATQPPDKEAIRARKNIATCEALSPPPSEEPAVEPSPPAAREQPEPAKRAPIVQREQRAWWSDGVGMTLLTSGLIGVGVGTGFAVAAGSAADDTALATNTDEWSAAHDRWQRNRMIAAIALGTGGALVISGVLRLSLRDRNVAVTPHGSGAMVSLGGSW